MNVWVDAVAALAPGIGHWDEARALFRGERSLDPSALPPLQPACLAPAERRRASPTVRLAISAAEQALAHSPIPPAEMAMVFASYEAAGVITHQLCEVLAGSREVSPTQFHNSVHNAPSGYYSIAMNARLAASSICRGEWSFAAGLMAAAVQCASDDAPVLFVCYDSPLPAPLAEVMPVLDPTAIALVLTPARTGRSLAGLALAMVPCAAHDDWPAWMPPRWRTNACARGLPLLGLLAGDAARATLPLSPELSLEAKRC